MTSNSEEVKKLEPTFTTNPAELKGEIINVSLKKGVKFGFHLIGMTGALVQDKFTQVDEVDPESPADINGILPGDIIVCINQKCILGVTVDDVDGIFASLSVGDVVDIQLCRGYAMQKIPYFFVLYGSDIIGNRQWTCMIIDKDKKEEFFEKIKTGFRGIEDYAQILCSAYGEELPQKVINKIREKYGGEEGKKFTEKEIVVDKLVQLRIPLLFEVKREGEIYKVCIKNYRGYFSFITGGGPAWYYVLVDKDKEVAFVEKTKTSKIVVEDYGKVLYSGWGEDAPKDIKDKMFKEYGVADYVEWYMI